MSGAAIVSSAGERLRRVLSYTETQALQAVIEAVPEDQGVLVSSAICDEIGITRSVMVNALRLCEAAGVLETRSLGMKGTHIKFLDRDAVEQAVAS